MCLHNANREGGKHDTHITVLKPPMRHLNKNKITPTPIDTQLWCTTITREISLLANMIHTQGHRALYTCLINDMFKINITYC